MKRTVQARWLLLFVIVLFLSVIAVAYDYHNASQSKTCPICAMRGSLSSAVTEADFVPYIDNHLPCFALVERMETHGAPAIASSVSYRGPPPFTHFYRS